jgi:hypothetical protein
MVAAIAGSKRSGPVKSIADGSMGALYVGPRTAGLLGTKCDEGHTHQPGDPKNSGRRGCGARQPVSTARQSMAGSPKARKGGFSTEERVL